MANQIDNVVVNDDSTGLNRSIDVASDDLFLSVDLTLQSGAIFEADNIKRGSGDPTGSASGNEGDLFMRTDAGVGSLYVNTDGTNTGWALVATGAVSVFGTEYTYGESLGNSSTTSSTYIQKLKVTTASVPAGDYVVMWAYEWNLNSTFNSFAARVQVDDTTTLAEQVTEPKDNAATQYRPSGGVAQVTLTAASHDIDIDFRRAGGFFPPTATIRRVRVALWRVA